MLGIIIGLIIGVVHFLGGNHELGSLVTIVANFLFPWYAITSGIILGFLGIILLLMTLGGGVAGACEGGVIGGAVGFVGGGAMSAVALVIVAVHRAPLVIGAWLLKGAYLGKSEWNMSYLIVGGILLLIGLIMTRNSNTNSNTSGN